MSTMNLNLLPSQAKFQAARTKVQTISRKAMVVMLTVWILALVVVYGYSLFVNSVLAKEETKLKRVTDDYVALADNIVTSQKLKYKAKLVGGVLDQRFEYGKAFETVTKLFPESIKLDNFELKKQGQFDLFGSTTGGENVKLLENLITSINNQENEHFDRAVLKSISTKSGLWTFSMEVKLR